MYNDNMSTEMEEPSNVYRDGYDSALAGYSLILGNPFSQDPLSEEWHDWREGWLLGKRQKALREDQYGDSKG
jgi:hypothetical protein